MVKRLIGESLKIGIVTVWMNFVLLYLSLNLQVSFGFPALTLCTGHSNDAYLYCCFESLLSLPAHLHVRDDPII